jgi:hypothetical protein
MKRTFILLIFFVGLPLSARAQCTYATTFDEIESGISELTTLDASARAILAEYAAAAEANACSSTTQPEAKRQSVELLARLFGDFAAADPQNGPYQVLATTAAEVSTAIVTNSNPQVSPSHEGLMIPEPQGSGNCKVQLFRVSDTNTSIVPVSGDQGERDVWNLVARGAPSGGTYTWVRALPGIPDTGKYFVIDNNAVTIGIINRAGTYVSSEEIIVTYTVGGISCQDSKRIDFPRRP